MYVYLNQYQAYQATPGLSNHFQQKKILKLVSTVNMLFFRYITSVKENVEEGTRLKFEGSLDRIEDLDKVKLSEHQHSTLM